MLLYGGGLELSTMDVTLLVLNSIIRIKEIGMNIVLILEILIIKAT